MPQLCLGTIRRACHYTTVGLASGLNWEHCRRVVLTSKLPQLTAPPGGELSTPEQKH
jgi:hypothetical protein